MMVSFVRLTFLPLLGNDMDRLTTDLEAMEAGEIPFDGDCISQALLSSAFNGVRPAEH